MRPKNVEYVLEVERRSLLYKCSPTPRPTNWKRNQTMKWLEQNPINNPADIAFLNTSVQHLRNELMYAQHFERGTATKDTAAKPTGAWRGTAPYLRVIMCLTEDPIKVLFLRRADAKTRQQLDARNSETR
jgi:hypothetical protein